ncbi:MAG TPA: amino acid adenylation domain-containing protein [Bryobacteraceae bacterium]|nr:amino acid adenylation domain-containing protein [Bryobacteraceae bacterium]
MTAKLLQDYVVRQAQLRPDEIAIVSGDERLTYSQLDRQSNSLAWRLRAAGCQRGDRVALLVPKSPLAIVSIIACLKTGCIYVPLDVDSPRDRLDLILESSSSRLLLAVASSASLAEKLLTETARTTRVAWLKGESEPTSSTSSLTPAFSWPVTEAATAPSNAGRPEDVAHLLFTSGSTGRPKGVMITHANVMSFVEWAISHFNYTPEDRISGHPPLHFDLSTFDIYGTFAAGAQLYLASAKLNVLPHKVAEFIRGNELTQWFSVPSLLSYMAKFDVVRPHDFPKLKRLLWCGERFPTPALIYWMKRLPHVEFTNLYGPTETTIASSFYRVPECPTAEDAPIPIGIPCGGESLLVLDERLQPPSAGGVGDLYIGGVGLSPGYWNDPERTRAVFLDEPFGPGSGRIYKTGDLASVGKDDLVYLHGRRDSQIKSRGYRIELGEIEVALQTTSGIREAAVIAIESSGFEGAVICCAVVPERGMAFEPQVLRSRLSQRLPHYMLPSHWLRFESLPLNGNGKVDKTVLRSQFYESLHPEVS